MRKIYRALSGKRGAPGCSAASETLIRLSLSKGSRGNGTAGTVERPASTDRASLRKELRGDPGSALNLTVQVIPASRTGVVQRFPKRGSPERNRPNDGELDVYVARAVLWDMDGTLVDSEELHWRAWRETMADEGISITFDQFLSSFGQRNDSVIPLWLGAGSAPERVRKIESAKEDRFRRLVRDAGVLPLPGAVRWVNRLSESGWLQAVASSAPRANVEAVLGEMGTTSYFQAIVSAEDVRRGKPDPEVFLLAASRLELHPTGASWLKMLPPDLKERVERACSESESVVAVRALSQT